MSKVVQAAEFFVVGGPVQPDRPCYVERGTDGALEAVIRARACALVLGARGIGKTSLLGRVARSLRESGELAAVVDLAQIAARGDDAEQDRWAYGIAHRVAHELRLRVDLPEWWREHTAVARESRLADFFWDVVLTNTTSPVTVLVDDVEQAVALPFGRELLDAIGACHERRSGEPDYARLAFVLAGVTSKEQLALAGAVKTELVEATDFTTDETYALAMGFGGERSQTQALMDRICVWTNGHPYFTQRVARGVARKGGKLEDVERVVHEQLLVPSALHEEPLASMRASLTERRPAKRRALRVLRRVARGVAVPAPADPQVRDALLLSGVVVRGEGGTLRYRNRIVRELFGYRWVKSVAPHGWRTAAAAVVVLAAAGLAGYAYVQYLPRSYERVLEGAGADIAALDEAYSQLHRLPGFAERADDLYIAALRARSGAATTLTELGAIDTRLRALAGQAETADRLLGHFWLRKTAAAADAERRDAALLYALRAAAGGGDVGDTARAWVASLVDGDYLLLDRTWELPAPPARWGVDWDSESLVSIDDSGALARSPLAPTASTSSPSPLALSALAHTALEREIRVEGEGSAGELELSVSIAHPSSSELSLTLTAPSGAHATVALPRAASADTETYTFVAEPGTPLGPLADEARSGVWRLTLIDRRIDNAGTLVGWGLRFDEQSSRDDPAEPVAIPDPRRTNEVALEVSSDDAFAIAQPATPSALGSVALWNLAEGRLQTELVLPAPPQRVSINAGGSRLLAEAGNAASLWSTADGSQVARLATQTQFVLPPIFSADGGYVAIAERVEDSPPLYSVVRAESGELVGSIEGVDGAQRWWLGPGARWLAAVDSSGLVHVLDARRGRELALLRPARRVAVLLPLPDGSTLLTVDDGGEIRAWPLDPRAPGAATGRLLGFASAADRVALAQNGSRVAYVGAGDEIVVRDVGSGARVAALRMDGADAPLLVRISSDGAMLVGARGGRLRVWSLPNLVDRAAPAADLDVASLAVDGTSDVVVIGSREGQLRVADAAHAASAAAAASTLGFFGHRGALTATAVSAASGVAASGGADGTVRIWDLASGAPETLIAASSSDGGEAQPIAALALSDDGRSVASAAGTVARVWRVADASPVAEITLPAAVTALAFSRDGAKLAAGASDGTLRIAALDGGAADTAQANGAIASLAFSPQGARLASATAAGVQLWLASGAAAGEVRVAGARWIGFGSDDALLVATTRWLHEYSAGADGALKVLHSIALQASAAASRAFAVAGAGRVRVAAFDSRGSLALSEIDVGDGPRADSAAFPELVARDWAAIIGFRLNDAGEVVPILR